MESTKAEAIYFVKHDLPSYCNASSIVLTLIQLEGEKAGFVCVVERGNEYVYSSLWLIHYSIAAVNAKYDFSSNRCISSLITVHHNGQGARRFGHW